MEWINETVDLVKIQWLRFTAILLVSSFTLSISSDILLIPSFKINPFLAPIRIMLIGVIAVLMATNITIILSRANVKKSTSVLGFLSAFFASSCIICQPFWLITLGFGTATAFLADISIQLMLLSIALLAFSIYQSSKKICEVKHHGKNI